MKLITKEIESKLMKSPLYSGEETPIEERKIIVKFFNPCGAGRWYVLEAEKQEDGDWLFYGYVDLLEKEFGYFTLSQLEEVRLPYGLKIERDLYFKNRMLKEVM